MAYVFERWAPAIRLSLFVAVLVMCASADVKVVQTSQIPFRRLTPVENLNWTTAIAWNSTTITLNRSERFQIFEGFGGAFTESAAHVFYLLNEDLQDQIIKDYFDPDVGLGYVMGRVPMGSCDFALKPYSYSNVSNDTSLEHFSIEHDLKQMLPLMHRAANASGQRLKLVASPWSAPGWMKDNGEMVCGIATCLFCRLKKSMQDTWALYFSKFLDAYREQDVPVWAVTVQNEPNACSVTYEGMHWDPHTERDFIKGHLGPRLRQDHPEVKILMYDYNKKDVMAWVDIVLGDPEAAQYVDGTALHWYDGDHFDQLTLAHEAQPSKLLVASEATVARNPHPDLPVWSNGEHYAHDIIGDLNAWVVAWIDWNLLLDRFGGPDHAGPEECEGDIKCGSSAMMMAALDLQVVWKQIFYYYVGHFSKYIRPGSQRIGFTNASSTLEFTAFERPDNQTAFVIMNPSDKAESFQLVDNGRAVRTELPPHAIQTFLW